MNTNKSLFKEFEEEIDQMTKMPEGKALTFVLNSEEYFIENEFLISYLYPLLIKSTICYESKTKIFHLPNTIDKFIFDLFLNFLSFFNSEFNSNIESSLNKLDFSSIKRTIDVCLFFNATELIIQITNQFVVAKIDKRHCLDIMKQFIDLTSIETLKELYIEIIDDCSFCAAVNLFYLLNHQKDKLISLNTDKLEEIIELYFKTSFYSNNADDFQIMNLLMQNRKINNDIFELLENERKRDIITFEKYYSCDKFVNPTLIVKIQGDDAFNGIFKEKQIRLENIDLLLINYYDEKNDVFNLAVQILQINLQDGVRAITHTNGNQKHNNPPNFANNTYEGFSGVCENHIISILSVCQIPEIDYQTKTNFNCIYSNSRSRVLVFKIANFSHYFPQKALDKYFEFTLKIYFLLNYNFSSILNHICKSFHEYYSLSSISKISKIVLNIILKNECLNYRNEDDILYAVTNWMSGKTNSDTINSIYLFKNINWKNVSLDALINLLLFENKSLFSVNEFKTIVFNEFQRRFQEEYLGSDKDYSVSFTDTEANNSKFNFSRMNNDTTHPKANSSNFTFDMLNKLIAISDHYNLTSLGKTEKKEAPEPKINYSPPEVEKESLPEAIIKPNRNRSNGSNANNHQPVTISYLVKKHERKRKSINQIQSVRNIPTMSTISKLVSQTIQKTKLQSQLNTPSIQTNLNSYCLSYTNPNSKTKLKQNLKKFDNSLIGRLNERSVTPDDVKTNPNNLNLNKSNFLAMTNKSKSLEKKQKSQLRIQKYRMQNNYLSLKILKTSSQDKPIPNKKHINTSARSELMKTEPIIQQQQKFEMKRSIHYRSQSNH